MLEGLSRPWPWWIAGPLIGLFVPLLLLLGNKILGISSNLRHLCAAALPGRVEFFRYDWRKTGSWNLAFALGIVAGGFLAGHVFANPDPVSISARTRGDLEALGLGDVSGLVPREVFSWESLLTLRGFAAIVLGGFLVGFGTAYAGGCTSGHGLSGVADLQIPSFLALLGFFAGGILGTFLVVPAVLG